MKKQPIPFTCAKCRRKDTFDPTAGVKIEAHLADDSHGGSVLAYYPHCTHCGTENKVLPPARKATNGRARQGAERTIPMSAKRKPAPAVARNRRSDTSGFWQPKTVEELAAEQGVHPVADPAELRGDFWPANESTDDFLNWLRRLRQEEKGEG